MYPEEKEDEIDVIEESDVEIVDEKKSGDELDSSKEDDKPKVVQKTKVEHKKRGGGGKRGNSADVKIKQLWAKAKEKDALLLAANSKNAEFEKITANALEESINNKRELLKERILRAKESDDSKREAELLAELSKVDAQSAQIDRYKLEKSVNPQEKVDRSEQSEEYEDASQEPQTFDDIYERQNRSGKEWLDKNRDWFDTESDGYDEDKKQDVEYYASSLNAAFARSGAGFPPGSKGYWAQIDRYIKDNWSDNSVNEDESESEEVAQPKTKSYAAPVGNRNIPGAPQKKKEYKITRDEREMAVNMKMRGKDGRELSDDEKIKRFVHLRESTPQSGPISIKDVRR